MKRIISAIICGIMTLLFSGCACQELRVTRYKKPVYYVVPPHKHIPPHYYVPGYHGHKRNYPRRTMNGRK